MVAIAAVLFDYGLVLTGPPDPGARAAMEHVLNVDEAGLQKAYWRHRDAYDRGALSGVTYWRAVASDLNRPLDDATLATLIAADTRLWSVPNQPMINWALYLQDGGIPTGILSNLGDCMEHGIRAQLPWISRFAHCTFSHRLRMAKPDPAIFRSAAAALGQPVHEILFIDDKIENILAARAAGMLGVHYTRFDSFRHEIEQGGYDPRLVPTSWKTPT